jgi:Protein of unknown function (DUF1812).
MMKEDRSDCPDCRNPLRVHLRYDYNTQRANMFSDHVEEATVFVVSDATDLVVDRQAAANNAESQPLRTPTFVFNIEGLMPGRYRLYAIGRSAADAAFRMTEPVVGESISLLRLNVPTEATGHVPAQRLDTMWTALNPITVDVPEHEATEATIPLMRLTNDLSIMVFRRDTPADNSYQRYEVSVTDSVTYRPFAQWTTETTADGTIAERTAHYDLSLGRLVNHEDARRNARLVIRNREDGTEVVNIDLCYYLSLARNAYESQHYAIQEYLDREYDYRLDFGLEGNQWKTITIRIDVLSWALRIQNEEL